MAREEAQFPPLPALDTIRRRLPFIFPEGTQNRKDAINENAAAAAFVMLYVGAVEGANRWVRPDQITRMTSDQASKRGTADRSSWSTESMRRLRPGEQITNRWYAHGTREGIRDDTIRNAWLPSRAVVKRQGLPTTSDRPTWALEAAFADLLTWGIPDTGEPEGIETMERSPEYLRMLGRWQERHLSREARTRVELLRRLVAPVDAVSVDIPNRGPRHLAAGMSSRISKAVIEEFAPRFLTRPGVIWLSESSNQTPLADSDLASAVGLNIQDSGILPDVILVDLEPEKPLLVFCEVVATDGPMSESRKLAILDLVRSAGYDSTNIALLTAFIDRDTPAYKKAAPVLASGSFVWVASEPDKLIVHLNVVAHPTKLTEVLHWVSSRRRDPAE